MDGRAGCYTCFDDAALGTEVEMSKRIVTTDQAPAAVGPYSQGVVLDGWVWTCGQVALDPETGEMVGSDAATQTSMVRHARFALVLAATPVAIHWRAGATADHRRALNPDPLQRL